MRVLYLGEDSLNGAGKYLAAALKWSRLSFDYVPNRQPIPPALIKRRYSAVLLSDYGAKNWSDPGAQWLKRTLSQGTGLVMVGGWASFTGLVGGYARSPIGELLPVRCLPRDDRVNRPAVLLGDRLIAVVNGYHRCRVRAGSRVRLNFRDLILKRMGVVLGRKSPALVTGSYGQGRTLAFLTDCAPHWAGGLVDWGTRRVNAKIDRQTSVEVGEAYLRFLNRWMLWVCGR